MAGAGFEVVDAVDGAEIYGVDGETVEGVGGQRDDLAGFECVDDTQHEVRLWLLRMNAKHLCDQERVYLLQMTLPQGDEDITRTRTLWR